MTDAIREQISALLDGELPQGETGLLVRRLERDAELRRTFASYVLAGECLRAPGGIVASRGFAARVGAALDDGAVAADPAPAAPSAPARWKRGAAGLAVAAGAALAAVLLVRPEASRDQFATRDPSGVRPAAVAAMAALPAGGASPTMEQSQRLAGLLVAHGQYASPIARRVAWSNALATDPGIARVPQEVAGQR